MLAPPAFDRVARAAGGDAMTPSSADPERLRHFTEGAAPLTARLRASGEGVIGAYNAFRQSGSAYGGGLGGLSAFVQVLSHLSPNEALVKAGAQGPPPADAPPPRGGGPPPPAPAAAPEAAGGGGAP